MSGQPEKAPETTLPKRVKKIAESDMTLNLSGQSYNTWLAKLPVGTEKKDVLSPIFWSHVAKNLRPMDRIEVWACDGTVYGEFLVTFADSLNAKLVEKQWIELESDDPDTGADVYVIKWISPPLKYGVIRKADKERVKDGFDTKAEANKWIQDHKKALS